MNGSFEEISLAENLHEANFETTSHHNIDFSNHALKLSHWLVEEESNIITEVGQILSFHPTLPSLPLESQVTFSNYCPNLENYIHLVIHPIDLWIEDSSKSKSLPWHFFLLVSHDYHSNLGHSIFQTPSYHHLLFEVSLFWFLIKHKGKIFHVNHVIKWLHSIFDFT